MLLIFFNNKKLLEKKKMVKDLTLFGPKYFLTKIDKIWSERKNSINFFKKIQ